MHLCRPATLGNLDCWDLPWSIPQWPKCLAPSVRPWPTQRRSQDPRHPICWGPPETASATFLWKCGEISQAWRDRFSVISWPLGLCTSRLRTSYPICFGDSCNGKIGKRLTLSRILIWYSWGWPCHFFPSKNMFIPPYEATLCKSISFWFACHCDAWRLWFV